VNKESLTGEITSRGKRGNLVAMSNVLSLSLAIALFTSSLWLISEAASSSEISLLTWPILAVLLFALAGALLHTALRKQDQSDGTSSSLIATVIIGFFGSGILFSILPLAGITTLTLFLIATFLTRRLTTTSGETSDRDVTDSEALLSQEIEAVMSHQIEGRIFRYAARLDEGLTKSHEEISKIEQASVKRTGFTILTIQLIMGSTIIINGILAITAVQAESLDPVKVAIALLLPIAIFNSSLTQLREAK
jgi:ABC-type transport system involved in cytochrome bd biosynthesis fused ATPase/permease subunit